MAQFVELKLPAAVEGSHAEALIGELLSLRGCPLVLDASALERVGGLGLQVLLSAKATWAADGQPLQIRNITPSVRDVMALCGASSLSL